MITFLLLLGLPAARCGDYGRAVGNRCFCRRPAVCTGSKCRRISGFVRDACADCSCGLIRVDLATLLTTPPRHVNWRERRRFNANTAGVWQSSEEGTNLTPKDREIVADICFKSNSVYENGVGESTRICTFTGLPRYTGVDGDVKWLENVMKTAPAHYRFHWADIGPVAAYSQPTDRKSTPKWALASFAALSAEEQAFDFYFVDGRFRVASFAASMLHALLRGNKDALFGMHDYARMEYHRGCEAIGDIVRGYGLDAGARLAIFQMKAGVTPNKIIAVWNEHKLRIP